MQALRLLLQPATHFQRQQLSPMRLLTQPFPLRRLQLRVLLNHLLRRPMPAAHHAVASNKEKHRAVAPEIEKPRVVAPESPKHPAVAFSSANRTTTRRGSGSLAPRLQRRLQQCQARQLLAQRQRCQPLQLHQPRRATSAAGAVAAAVVSAPASPLSALATAVAATAAWVPLRAAAALPAPECRLAEGVAAAAPYSATPTGSCKIRITGEASADLSLAPKQVTEAQHKQATKRQRTAASSPAPLLAAQPPPAVLIQHPPPCTATITGRSRDQPPVTTARPSPPAAPPTVPLLRHTRCRRTTS